MEFFNIFLRGRADIRGHFRWYSTILGILFLSMLSFGTAKAQGGLELVPNSLTELEIKKDLTRTFVLDSYSIGSLFSPATSYYADLYAIIPTSEYSKFTIQALNSRDASGYRTLTFNSSGEALVNTNSSADQGFWNYRQHHAFMITANQPLTTTVPLRFELRSRNATGPFSAGDVVATAEILLIPYSGQFWATISQIIDPDCGQTNGIVNVELSTLTNIEFGGGLSDPQTTGLAAGNYPNAYVTNLIDTVFLPFTLDDQCDDLAISINWTQDKPLPAHIPYGESAIVGIDMTTNAAQGTMGQVLLNISPSLATLSANGVDIEYLANNVWKPVSDLTSANGLWILNAQMTLKITNNSSYNTCSEVNFDLIAQIDDNGSIVSSNTLSGAFVLEKTPVSIDVRSKIEPRCGLSEGAITFNIGGTTNYTYELWLNGQIVATDAGTQEDLTLDNLATGDYRLVVKDADCISNIGKIETVLSTQSVSPLLVRLRNDLNPSKLPTCSDPENGIIVLEFSGGTGEYLKAELWKNGVLLSSKGGSQNSSFTGTQWTPNYPTDAPTSVTGISAGRYIVRLFDVCTDIEPFELEFDVALEDVSPLVAAFSAAAVLPTCAEPESGELEVTITGGSLNATGDTDSEAYTVKVYSNGYQIATDIAATAGAAITISDLVAGEYTIVITDDNCPANPAITLTTTLGVEDVVPLTANVIVEAQPSCAEPDAGEIVIIAEGGTSQPVYRYSIRSQEGTLTEPTDQNRFTNLSAGQYTIIVTDDNCPSLAHTEIDVILQDIAVFPLRVTLASPILKPSCANNDGEISVTADYQNATTHTPDFRYVWSTGYTSSGPTSKIANLPAGTYSVTVSDAACPAVIPVIVVYELPKDLNLIEVKIDDTINPTCPQGSDGAINISVIGGNGDYIYLWTGPNGFAAEVEDITDLEAGVYSVTVAASGDGYSCSATVDNIVISDPINWSNLDLSDYLHYVGQNIEYWNGQEVSAISLLTNPLPEGVNISWVNDNTTTGIPAQGDGEIPPFRATNLVPGGTNVSRITVTISDPRCETNNHSGVFTISVRSETIEDYDLRALPETGQSQTVCFDELFSDITFHARRTDGLPLGKVSWLVNFVSGVDVLQGEKTGSIPLGANGFWDISSVPVNERKAGVGLYEAFPRSENGQGIPVRFTLEVLPEPSVDPISDQVYCNGEEYIQSFTTSGDAATTFTYTADAAAVSLGIPATGNTKIDVRLTNATDNPVTGTITVTPHLASCPNSAKSITYTVTVLPTPKVRTIDNQVWGHNDFTNAVDFTIANPSDGSTSVGTIFRWVASNPAIAATPAEATAISSGQGTVFPSFQVSNTSNQPAMTKITITPVYVDPVTGYECVGEQRDFYILVAAKPNITAIDDRTYCEGENVAPIVTDGLPAGAGYYVTWEGGANIGLADYTQTDAAIAGYPTKRALNQFTAQIQAGLLFVPTIVTIEVTPHLYYMGLDFPGDKKSFNITVIPQAKPAIGYDESVVEYIEYCSAGLISMDVQSSQGTNLTYQWYKDHYPIAGETSDELVFNTSVDHKISGKYYCEVKGDCGSYRSKTYDILVKLDVLVQRWNDILSVNCIPEENGGFSFSDFKWYKVTGYDANGNPIGTPLYGETRSWIDVSLYGIGDSYFMEASTQNGTTYRSCDKAVVNPAPAEPVSLYPNPVTTNEIITVTGISYAATLSVVDYSGVILKTVSATAGVETKFEAPNKAGVYILRVVSKVDGSTKEFKIIVK